MKLPVLSLQPLIENAVKHNSISRTKPLRIAIRTDDGTLVVSNPLIPKIDETTGTGIGLKNLSSRYLLLTSQQVRIIRTDDAFEVILPLIESPNPIKTPVMTRKLIVSPASAVRFCRSRTTSASTAAPLPDEKRNGARRRIALVPGTPIRVRMAQLTLVPARKLAEVLETPVENVRALAESMGPSSATGDRTRMELPQGYITVLRRNWHLLPYDQLLTLLGITREELAWRLIEDDYLFVKLGSRKPYCPPLHYEKPSEQAERQAARIAAQVRDIRPATAVAETPRFAFIDEFSRSHKPALQTTGTGNGRYRRTGFALRIIYPYCATFGDPLTDPGTVVLSGRIVAAALRGRRERNLDAPVLRTLVPPDGIFRGRTMPDCASKG